MFRDVFLSRFNVVIDTVFFHVSKHHFLLMQDELVDEVLLLRLPPEERGVVLLQPLVLELLLLHQGRQLLSLGGALLGVSKRSNAKLLMIVPHDYSLY